MDLMSEELSAKELSAKELSAEPAPESGCHLNKIQECTSSDMR